jgi:hypothetical protein
MKRCLTMRIAQVGVDPARQQSTKAIEISGFHGSRTESR